MKDNAKRSCFYTRSELTSAMLGTDEYAYAFDNIGNRMISAENGTDRNYAANQLNQYTAISNPTFNPSYDDDGNELTVRTGTGAWVIEYNAENRPVTFTQGTTVIECKYDSQGRRFEKKVTANGTVTFWQRYADRGYLQIAAFNVTLDAETEAEVYTLATTTMWDPMEQTATRPLAFTDHTGATPATYFYTHDLTKNVCELLNATDTIVTTYDYTPFGAVTASNSATPNTIMFSSEVFDSEVSLVYYNFRHYNPLDGRWINRDPIEELGEWNLYLNLKNKQYNFVDQVGMSSEKDDCIAGKKTAETIFFNFKSNNGTPFFNDCDVGSTNLKTLLSNNVDVLKTYTISIYRRARYKSPINKLALPSLPQIKFFPFRKKDDINPVVFYYRWVNVHSVLLLTPQKCCKKYLNTIIFDFYGYDKINIPIIAKKIFDADYPLDGSKLKGQGFFEVDSKGELLKNSNFPIAGWVIRLMEKGGI